MKKNIFLLFLLSILVLPVSASAFACAGNATSITGIVCNLGNLVQGLAIFVVVVSWIITGILFLIAQGDPAKLTKARQALIWAIVGTAVAFLAGSAILIVGNAISNGG